MSIFLHKLTLTNFRSYEAEKIEPAGTSFVIFSGPNGAGKTNVLEAVSLLAPGRGLRGALLQDMTNRTHPDSFWAIAAEVETGGVTGRQRIGTGLAALRKKRVIRINGQDVKSQSALAPLLAAVWVTPQMDRIFLEGPAARRRFLDRLVFAFDPAHVGRLGRYEKNLRARIKLLTEQKPVDPQWLRVLEAQLAADAVAVAAARAQLLERLQEQLVRLQKRQTLFPVPSLSLQGWVDTEILRRPALSLEEELIAVLQKNRRQDALAGKTGAGVHRSDLIVQYAEKNMPAAECSTGEQKGLLLAIVLAHAQMLRAEHGRAPLILLDEVAAHLDEDRREQLFSLLRELATQVWLTGTEAQIFRSLADVSRSYAVLPEHRIQPQMEGRARG